MAVFLCRALLRAVKPYSTPNEFVSFLPRIILFRGLEVRRFFRRCGIATELAADYTNEPGHCHRDSPVRIGLIDRLTNRSLPFPEHLVFIAPGAIYRERDHSTQLINEKSR